MPEQAEDIPHESEETATVDNHVAGDMPPESNVEDVTMDDGSASVPEQADDIPHESKEAATVDNLVAGEMPPESNVEDVIMVDGSASVPNGSPAP